MLKDFVSVIVPVYNVSKYVEKCVDSILNQTYKNIEIVIVNDGSTDDSLSILTKRYSNKPNIKIISQENKGLSGARNTGIQNCSGEYLCFVDSDDWVSSEYVEKLYNSAKENDADISICNIEYIYADGSTQKNPPRIHKDSIIDRETAIHYLILRNPFGSHAYNKIYKASLFKENNIFYPDRKICEDVFTTYRLILKSKKISLVSDILYYYLQQRPESILNSKFKVERITDVIEAFKNFYRDVNVEFPNRDNSDFVNWKIDMILGFYTIIAEQIRDYNSNEFKHAVSIIRAEAKNVHIVDANVSQVNRMRFIYAKNFPRAYCTTLKFLKRRAKK